MLIEFEVGNFLSFKDIVRFSMVAATPFKEFEVENTFKTHRFRLLKTAAIYGANASGKSNLLSAIKFMQQLVLNSAKEMQSVDTIDATPYKLDVACENAPSHFQITFLMDEVRYRYGFEVDRKAVKKEWLYAAEANREHPLFLREDAGIDVRDRFKEGKGLEVRTRDNALFLSTVDQLNGQLAKKLLECFSRLRMVHGLNDQGYERITAGMLQDDKMRPLVLKLIHWADLGIEDFAVNEEEMDTTDWNKFFTDEFKKLVGGPPTKRLRVSAMHPKYANGARVGFVTFDLRQEESEGTKKFFRMVGPILECLQSGCVVLVDELDAKLHPLLTRALVRLFHTPETNPQNAQLIFGTHDTNLLYYGKFRRDQIWFTEKNEQGATELYSLAEFKLPKGTKVRKDASFEKDYIRGRYGAIPYLGDFEKLFREEDVNGTASQSL